MQHVASACCRARVAQRRFCDLRWLLPRTGDKDFQRLKDQVASFATEPSAYLRRGNIARVAATMKTAWTLSTSFEHFGAARSRRHFGGSAISDDGGTVVVAMWEDEIVRQDNRVTYQSRFGPPLRGKSQKLSLQWITNLKWAIARCDGRVRVVVLTAEDMQANPRVVSSCYPDDTLIMRITRFNAKTGCFEARTS